MADDFGGALFVGGVDGGEDAADGYGLDAFVAHLEDGFADFFVVKGGDFASVEFVAAGDHVVVAADGLLERVGPVAEGREEGGGGEAEAEDGGVGEAAALQQGVGEVGGAEHDGGGVGVVGRVLDDGADGGFDAGGYVGGCGEFGLGRGGCRPA